MKDSSPDGNGILFYACGGYSAASVKKIEWTAGIASCKNSLKLWITRLIKCVQFFGKPDYYAYICL
ncbi:MAG: hypothetical protein CUR32_02320 [Flavobacterium sp.]|nr:MAG: hypothetical protein CUR32_02320 [Flavobacterium sp.] [Flavobacterium sp. FEMGT703F]